jgi:integrase
MAGRRGNNEGNIRKHHDGRWEARYTLPDGKRRSLMGKTRAEIARKLTEALRERDRGVTAPRDERQTLGAYLDSWLQTKKPETEPGYWLRCEQYVRLHIKPNLGRTTLVKLTAQQLSALYARKLEEGAAANTVRHLHATLHVALEDALRLDLVARNVADLVRPPRAPHLEMTAYTPEQANALMAAAQGDRLEALYVLMLTTACRLGELLGLRWAALDLERGEMQIATALKEVSAHRSIGKTARSRRSIPLTPLAMDSLVRHREAQDAERRQRARMGVEDWNPQRLVFCTTTGNSYARSNWRLQQYKPMIDRAGLPYVRPHDLRHTAATLLLLEGVQPLVVSEMLGHASVAFTLATYGHVLADMRKPARDAMERLFGGAFTKLGAELGANPLPEAGIDVANPQ